MISKNKNIFNEVEDIHNVAESGFHNSLVAVNCIPQKPHNFCYFFIAYSAFPNLKIYGKISQNQERKFFEKALKKFFEEHHLAPRFLTRLLKNDSKFYNYI